MKIRIKEKTRKAINFLKEVRLEMRKINWLSFKDCLRYTLIVILVSVVVAFFLGGIDFVFALFLNRFFL